MKKVFSVILILAMLVLVFAGCGKEYKSNDNSEISSEYLYSIDQSENNTDNSTDEITDQSSENGIFSSNSSKESYLIGKWKRVVSSEKKVISYLIIKNDGSFESSIETPDGSLLIETGNIKEYTNKGKIGISNVVINDTARRIMGYSGGGHFIEKSYKDYVDTLNIHNNDYLYFENTYEIANQLKVGDIVLCEWNEYDDAVSDSLRKIAEIRKLTIDDYKYPREYEEYEYYYFDEEYYKSYINNLITDSGFITSNIKGDVKNTRAIDIYLLRGRYIGRIQNFSAAALSEYDETMVTYKISGNKLTIENGFVYDKC